MPALNKPVVSSCDDDNLLSASTSCVVEREYMSVSDLLVALLSAPGMLAVVLFASHDLSALDSEDAGRSDPGGLRDSDPRGRDGTRTAREGFWKVLGLIACVVPVGSLVAGLIRPGWVCRYVCMYSVPATGDPRGADTMTEPRR